MGRKSIFQNKEVENFKNLEVLESKRDFINFFQVITFDTFMLANLNFMHIYVLYWEYYRKIKNLTVIG